MTTATATRKPAAKKAAAVEIVDPAKNRAARRAAAKKAVAEKATTAKPVSGKAKTAKQNTARRTAEAAATSFLVPGAVSATAQKRAAKAAEAEQMAAARAVAVDALSQTDRLNLAKVEAAEKKAWKAAGSIAADEPATPVLDWMNGHSAAERKTASKKASTAAKLSPEDTATVEGIVRSERAAGKSWKAVADAVNATGIKTSRGGPFWDTTCYAIGKALGLPTKK